MDYLFLPLLIVLACSNAIDEHSSKTILSNRYDETLHGPHERPFLRRGRNLMSAPKDDSLGQAVEYLLSTSLDEQVGTELSRNLNGNFGDNQIVSMNIPINPFEMVLNSVYEILTNESLEDFDQEIDKFLIEEIVKTVSSLGSTTVSIHTLSLTQSTTEFRDLRQLQRVSTDGSLYIKLQKMVVVSFSADENEAEDDKSYSQLGITTSFLNDVVEWIFKEEVLLELSQRLRLFHAFRTVESVVFLGFKETEEPNKIISDESGGSGISTMPKMATVITLFVFCIAMAICILCYVNANITQRQNNQRKQVDRLRQLLKKEKSRNIDGRRNPRNSSNEDQANIKKLRSRKEMNQQIPPKQSYSKQNRHKQPYAVDDNWLQSRPNQPVVSHKVSLEISEEGNVELGTLSPSGSMRAIKTFMARQGVRATVAAKRFASISDSFNKRAYEPSTLGDSISYNDFGQNTRSSSYCYSGHYSSSFGSEGSLESKKRNSRFNKKKTKFEKRTSSNFSNDRSGSLDGRASRHSRSRKSRHTPTPPPSQGPLSVMHMYRLRLPKKLSSEKSDEVSARNKRNDTLTPIYEEKNSLDGFQVGEETMLAELAENMDLNLSRTGAVRNAETGSNIFMLENRPSLYTFDVAKEPLNLESDSFEPDEDVDINNCLSDKDDDGFEVDQFFLDHLEQKSNGKHKNTSKQLLSKEVFLSLARRRVQIFGKMKHLKKKNEARKQKSKIDTGKANKLNKGSPHDADSYGVASKEHVRNQTFSNTKHLNNKKESVKQKSKAEMRKANNLNNDSPHDAEPHGVANEEHVTNNNSQPKKALKKRGFLSFRKPQDSSKINESVVGTLPKKNLEPIDKNDTPSKKKRFGRIGSLRKRSTLASSKDEIKHTNFDVNCKLGAEKEFAENFDCTPKLSNASKFKESAREEDEVEHEEEDDMEVEEDSDDEEGEDNHEMHNNNNDMEESIEITESSSKALIDGGPKKNCIRDLSTGGYIEFCTDDGQEDYELITREFPERTRSSLADIIAYADKATPDLPRVAMPTVSEYDSGDDFPEKMTPHRNYAMITPQFAQSAFSVGNGETPRGINSMFSTDATTPQPHQAGKINETPRSNRSRASVARRASSQLHEEAFNFRSEIISPKPHEGELHFESEIVSPKPHVQSEIVSPQPQREKIHFQSEIVSPQPHEVEPHFQSEIVSPQPREEACHLQSEIVSPKPREEAFHFQSEIVSPQPREEAFHFQSEIVSPQNNDSVGDYNDPHDESPTHEITKKATNESMWSPISIPIESNKLDENHLHCEDRKQFSKANVEYLPTCTVPSRSPIRPTGSNKSKLFKDDSNGEMMRNQNDLVSVNENQEQIEESSSYKVDSNNEELHPESKVSLDEDIKDEIHNDTESELDDEDFFKGSNSAQHTPKLGRQDDQIFVVTDDNFSTNGRISFDSHVLSIQHSESQKDAFDIETPASEKNYNDSNHALPKNGKTSDKVEQTKQSSLNILTDSSGNQEIYDELKSTVKTIIDGQSKRVGQMTGQIMTVAQDQSKKVGEMMTAAHQIFDLVPFNINGEAITNERTKSTKPKYRKSKSDIYQREAISTKTGAWGASQSLHESFETYQKLGGTSYEISIAKEDQYENFKGNVTSRSDAKQPREQSRHHYRRSPSYLEQRDDHPRQKQETSLDSEELKVTNHRSKRGDNTSHYEDVYDSNTRDSNTRETDGSKRGEKSDVVHNTAHYEDDIYDSNTRNTDVSKHTNRETGYSNFSNENSNVLLKPNPLGGKNKMSFKDRKKYNVTPHHKKPKSKNNEPELLKFVSEEYPSVISGEEITESRDDRHFEEKENNREDSWEKNDEYISTYKEDRENPPNNVLRVSRKHKSQSHEIQSKKIHKDETENYVDPWVGFKEKRGKNNAPREVTVAYCKPESGVPSEVITDTEGYTTENNQTSFDTRSPVNSMSCSNLSMPSFGDNNKPSGEQNLSTVNEDVITEASEPRYRDRHNSDRHRSYTDSNYKSDSLHHEPSKTKHEGRKEAANAFKSRRHSYNYDDQSRRMDNSIGVDDTRSIWSNEEKSTRSSVWTNAEKPEIEKSQRNKRRPPRLKTNVVDDDDDETPLTFEDFCKESMKKEMQGGPITPREKFEKRILYKKHVRNTERGRKERIRRKRLAQSKHALDDYFDAVDTYFGW